MSDARWRCIACTREGRGPAPDACPACGSARDERHGPHPIERTERDPAGIGYRLIPAAAADAAIADIRVRLARRAFRCDPACPGWIVSESDTYGTRIERCDECAGGMARPIDDADAARLPEAQAAFLAIFREHLTHGVRVKVKLADPAAWAYGAADALNGCTGVVSEIRPHATPPSYLIAFDRPAPTWWGGQTPPRWWWFEAGDLVPGPEPDNPDD